ATISEIDAIRRQVEKCWNVPAGAQNAENLVVSIRVWVNPDGTVAKATIIDASRMGSDPYFRAAAESARRAVLNDDCSPLPIPPKKYDKFKELVLSFNPKEAAGS
ncbi:MAG: cell envelope integrity protein TolA, partial [Alphaproteobacteria bacterium]